MVKRRSSSGCEAVAVPTAQGRIAIESGVGSAANVGQTAVRPDDRTSRAIPQSGVQLATVRPDDRAARVSPQPSNQLPVSLTPTGDRFDWSDAGIDAGFALGLILLAFGAMGATRHTGRKSLAGA